MIFFTPPYVLIARLVNKLIHLLTFVTRRGKLIS